MAHTHHHGKHDHHHDGHNLDERRVYWALLLTGGFMLAEVAGGIFSGSLALLADAGHMLADTAALGLSWYAFRVSRRGATADRSYGHHRFQVLAALINGGTLLGIAVLIIVEAARRIFQPIEVLGGPMLVIGVLGMLVNVAAFLILNGGSKENLNIRGAALHVLGDLLGSAAAIVAAGIILLTGWTLIDPILSVLVVLLILRSAWVLVRRSWHVLMEGAPEALDTAELRRALAEIVPEVLDIHHVHAWSLTPERPMLTFHARIEDNADNDAVLRRLQRELALRFGIEHATIQFERNLCTDAPHAADPTRHGHASSHSQR